jgi:hypothetical protein
MKCAGCGRHPEDPFEYFVAVAIVWQTFPRRDRPATLGRSWHGVVDQQRRDRGVLREHTITLRSVKRLSGIIP